MANVARRWGLFEPLRQFQAAGGAVWGTCAGLIFLAERINKVGCCNLQPPESLKPVLKATGFVC